MSELAVELKGAVIIVTQPGTNYCVVYQKAPVSDPALLLLIYSWLDPTVIRPEVSEFRARAFDAASRKARELGWIV
jgi:hypothetical protein